VRAIGQPVTVMNTQPKIVARFEVSQLLDLALLEAENIPQFNGKPLWAEVITDDSGGFHHIEVVVNEKAK